MRKPSNPIAKLLFSQAKGRLRRILALIDEFNEIGDALDDLGYRGPQGPEYPVDQHFPFLELTGVVGGCITIRAADELDPYWESGVTAKPKGIAAVPRVSQLAERKRLGEETGWKCFYCSRKGDAEKGPDRRAWHVDHVYPLSRAGDDQPDNHVLACATCNLQKHDASALEYIQAKARDIA